MKEIGFGAMVLRLALAMLCGGVIGYGRSRKERPAGFRTHILVCLGAAVAMMTGLYVFLELKLPTDISRLGTAVISGLGFIGAGTIVVTKKMSIKGLTTAAGLWTTGIIGLAVGAGTSSWESSGWRWCCWRRRCLTGSGRRSGIRRNMPLRFITTRRPAWMRRFGTARTAG